MSAFSLRHSATAAKVHVTVTDLSGVQRVLTLLTGRRYEFTRFSAEELGGGRWRTSFDVVVTADQGELLAERLHRIPTVLLVEMAMCVCRSGSPPRESRCVKAAPISAVTSTCATPACPRRV